MRAGGGGQLIGLQAAFTVHRHAHHAVRQWGEGGDDAVPVFIRQHAQQQGRALIGVFLLQHIGEGLGAGRIMRGIDNHLLFPQLKTLRARCPLHLGEPSLNYVGRNLVQNLSGHQLG